MSDDKKYIPQLTLETVWDIKNGKEIDAYEFFNQPESEIINMRNLLQLAINTNTPYYVCPYCRQMVKISGRKNERGKANFFSHLYDSDLCPIKTTTGLSKELINNKYRLVNESDRHKYLKSLIAQSLSSETSIQKGVSDVEIEKRIDSPIPYLRWRRPDVFAKYKNKNIVFELQLSTTFVSIIVDRDLFYRLNDYYIIWVFNFDDNKEYVNLSNLMCKDIYYANKRNVFIFDKEAQAASIERGELILKCNWLKPDNKWNYEKSNGGYSGVLVSLDQLSFDEDNKKPFFHDADAEYFSIHPDYLNIRKEIEADRQEIVQKIMEQEQKESDEYDGQTEQERERSILEMKRNGKRVSIFKKKNKYGLSYEDTIMVPAKYTSISDFDEHGHATIQYKKRKGIVDCYGRIIVPCEAAIINLVDNKYFIYHKSSTQYWFMSGIDEPIATYGNDNISVNDTENKKEIIKISFDENHDLWFWQKDKIFIINGIIAVFKNYSLDKPKWGAQYINGDVLVPFVFNNVKEITDAIRIEGNEMDFWVDSSSRYIFSQYSSIDIHGVNKLIVTHKNNFSGLARFDGKIVVDCKCDKIDYFGKYYILERDSKWAIADENGKIIYNYQDNIITMMTDNYIYMKDKEGKAFLCDNQRNFIRWNGNYSCIIETDVSGLFVVTSSAENKKGIVNLAGEIIIPCLYEDILPWGVNLYRVEKNIISKKEKPTWSFEDSEIRFEDKTEKRFYLINDSSNKTNPDLFKSIDRLSNGKIHAVTEDDREGYLDINGEMIPIKSESMGSGYNKIFSFGRWGVVDSNNNYILPCHFLEIDWFTNQIFKVKTSALHFQPYKLYDINGACISKGYFEIKSFENGYAAADNTYLNVHGEECFLPVMSLPNGNIIGHNHNHYGLYDEHGAVLSEPIYAKIDLWKKKLLFYYKTISNNKSCITIHNLDGSQIGNQGYDKIEDIEPGMCKVWLGEGYGFFDENWELIPVKSESMNGGYTKILSFGKWGVISSNKDIILPPNFLEIDWFTNQLFKVKTLSSRYQIYDLNGVCISKEFLLIDKLKDGYAVADDTFLDPQGKECFLPIVKLPNGCLIGFNHNHYGLYDEHGIILSEPVNDKIERWGENLLFYYKASKSNGIHSITIHRLDGTLLKNIKYDKIEQVEPGKCKVWVGNTYGYLDAKGKEWFIRHFE